jgi:RNA polymerase sigma-32 factor
VTAKPKKKSPKKAAPPPAERPTDPDEPVIEPEVVTDEEFPLDPAEVDVAALESALPAALDPASPEVPVVASGNALVRQDSLSAYLAEIRRYPVLSREEEHELAVRYFENGDRDAAYRLITSNLRLVVMIAREYQRAFHNLLDLIQEGNVGLLEAVKKFDPYRGVRLPSYAVWWIRAYVIRYIMNNFRLVKVGTTQAQRRLFFNLQKEKARLEAEGFKPTPALIAGKLGVKEAEVLEMEQRMSGGSEVSTDAPLSSDGEGRVIDLIPNEEGDAEEVVANREFYSMMRGKLAEFAQTLEGREKEIFEERLMAEDPITLQELGERYGVSRERVRQIEEALKRKVREYLVAEIRFTREEVLD